MHTTETDGRDTLEVMVQAAAARGLQYMAITDHSQNLAMANGMDEDAHARARGPGPVRLNGRYGSLTVLAGVECDILPDGRMDLADDCLAALDLVIGSVHSAMAQSEDEMTARIIRAIEHPHVDIIGHPTNRLLLRRPASQVNIEKVIDAAAANNVALEINSNPNRLDLSDSHARLARDRGVRLLDLLGRALDHRAGVPSVGRAWSPAAPGRPEMTC